MAPNASPFVNLFSNGHHHAAASVHKNVFCHWNNNHPNINGGSTLLQHRLKAIKENFVAVNGHFLRENHLEAAVDRYAVAPSDDGGGGGGARSLCAARLEAVRRALVKRSVRDKLEAWQKKRDEMCRAAGRFEISKFGPKPRPEEILMKKEDYKLTFDEIQNRAAAAAAAGRTNGDDDAAGTFDHRRRTREICFKAVLTKANLTVSTISECLGDPRLASNVGERIEAYRSMESRLGALRGADVAAGEVPLVAAKSLLEDLTLYKNNVVMPIRADLESRAAKSAAVKNCSSLNKFSVNVPGDHLVKHVRRQYVALVKNNKLLVNNLTAVKSVPFASDPTAKAFRQNLVKVVNTLVNTISCSSAALLTDRFDKLDALLGGRLVCVANTRVMIGRNEEAMAFCMETLSGKIVAYAEEVISVKTEAAHEIAAVVARLWNAHQRFGKVLFAEIKRKCPLLVPFCYPVAKSLTLQQPDRKSFGYRVDPSGNVVESDAKFLKRTTGVVRLYAALMVAASKYDSPVVGLSQGWIFVAGTLNQNPVADVTATMLVEFLNVVGFHMHRAYGQQFVKLLRYVDERYMKKIVAVTPAGHGGPVTRLDGFVSKCLRSGGSLEEPKGVLSSDFW